MKKVEIADKLHKLNHSKKKEANRIETKGNKSKNKTDLVSISSKSTALLSEPKALKNNPDIRVEMVKKYKEDIEKGTYEVKTNEIAEKIIQKYKDQTFHKPFP
jgi:flagellar biosynthesis anti-sigma factor FlgM|tara:strand:+ start:6763 stop:7071 length:309 start_codon:yes stop_codon:yes gene_type:complete